jgi:hypothetical protein
MAASRLAATWQPYLKFDQVEILYENVDGTDIHL